MQTNLDPYTNSQGEQFALSIQYISTDAETDHWLCNVRVVAPSGKSRTYKIFVLKKLVADLDQVVPFSMGAPLAYIKELLESFDEKGTQKPMPVRKLEDGWTVTIWGAGIPNSVVPLL